MTYGWAILVVLIVIGAFVYFGVLNPRQMVPNTCTVNGFKCNDHRLSLTNGVTISLTNAFGKDIIVGHLNFSSDTAGAFECGSGVGTGSDTIIMAGETGSINTRAAPVCTTNVRAGIKVKGKSFLNYTETESGIEHVAVINIVADAEP